MAHTGWWRVPPGFALVVALLALAAGWLPEAVRGLLYFLVMTATWLMLFYLAGRFLLEQAVDARRPGERNAVAVPEGLALRQMALWLLFSLLLAAAQATAGTPGLLAAGLLIALVAPAATFALVSGQTLSDALYPPEWQARVHSVGWSGYRALSLWLVFFALVYLLMAEVLTGVPYGLRNGVLMGWWSFALLAWSGAAGQLLRAPRRPGANQAHPAAEPVDPVKLFDQVMRQGGDIMQHRKLARLLAAAGDRRRALVHAQAHLPALLVTFQRPLEALEQADRLLGLQPSFCLEDPVMMRGLIGQARALAPAALTLSLCHNYLQRFRASLVRGEILLIACEVLAENDSLDGPSGQAWLEAVSAEPLDAKQRVRLEALKSL